jgi:uncharacterized protein YoaH (UPF0181 family)
MSHTITDIEAWEDALGRLYHELRASGYSDAEAAHVVDEQMREDLARHKAAQARRRRHE